MYETILVPIDGSTFSEHALPVAVDLARRTGAYLHLVQVHIPEPMLTPEGIAFADPTWEREFKDQEREYLRDVAERHRTPGVAIRTELIEGQVAESLKLYAAEEGVDLVVMTTHGRGGISRAWLGSVADALVRQLRLPVLLLRPQHEVLPFATGSENILIPLDGSELSERIINCTVSLGQLTHARYTLLRVVAPAYVGGQPYVPTLLTEDPLGIEQQIASADVYLDGVAERMRSQGLEVTTAVVTHPQPALAILEYAEALRPGLIAMATHGRGGWARLALGSVADKVLRATETPVLLYRPPVVGSDRWSTRKRAEVYAMAGNIEE
jgi:nucleotide-binding universal stress UspA family protein